jgi:tetratricopeptide (TPR) repeat protein
MEQIERGISIGRYVVLSPIASGSMGAVFAAYDPELDRKVALKLLRIDLPGVDPDEMRARFMREAQAMARVVHPHVITVFDIGTYGPHAFFAMNFVEGGTLSTWLKEAERTESDIIAVYSKAGAGLAAAHSAGLVHRDFKPDNVLVSYDGQIFVTDFGLVRAGDSVELGAEPEGRGPVPSVVARRPMLEVDLTEAQVLMGTPRYMAPEQMDRLDADARTDQFSFCVALFEALYGQRPFQGATLGVVRKQMQAGDISMPNPKQRGSARVLNALLRGLSADPAQRFPTMDALLQTLARSRPWWAKRRLIAAAVLAGLSVTALAVGAGMGALTHQLRVCAGAEDQLKADWSEASREALRTRWRAAPGTQPDAAARAEASLDNYASAWAKSYADACEATHVRGEQSEETLALRMECLDARRREWAALVKLMSEGPQAVPRGTAAPAFLSRPAQCADVVALREGSGAPAEAPARKAVLALEESLSQAKAYTAAGRPAEALALADTLKVTASQLAFAPLQARVAQAHALSAVQAGDTQRAKPLLLEAAWLTQAAGADRLATLAWNELALYAAQSEKRLDEAFKLWRQADALSRRVGVDDELKAAVLYSRGILSAAQSKPDEAVDALTHALKMRVALYGEVQPETIDTQRALGAALKAQGKHTEAAAALAKSTAAVAQLYGKTHPVFVVAQLEWSDAMWEQLPQRPDARRRVEALMPAVAGDATLKAKVDAWLSSHAL